MRHCDKHFDKYFIIEVSESYSEKLIIWLDFHFSWCSSGLGFQIDVSHMENFCR